MVITVITSWILGFMKSGLRASKTASSCWPQVKLAGMMPSLALIFVSIRPCSPPSSAAISDLRYLPGLVLFLLNHACRFDAVNGAAAEESDDELSLRML